MTEAAWRDGSAIARREAAAALLSAMTSGAYGSDDFWRLLETARDLHRRYPEESAVRSVMAQCLAVLGDDADFDALYADVDAASLSEAERVILALRRIRSDGADGRGQLERLFLQGAIGADKRRYYALVAAADPFFAFTVSGRAIRGRLAVYDRSYGEALRQFRSILGEDETVFFNFVDLLSDLGKAYQYADADSAREGIVFFESKLLNSDGLSMELRYKLLFYTARLRRQLGQYEKAESYFSAALPIAPFGEQRDACIWYSLDSALKLSLPSAIERLRILAPSWRSAAFFNDLLNDLCLDLVVAKNWSGLLKAFRAIRSYAAPSVVARYAYLLGRAVELDYLKIDRPWELSGRSSADSLPTEENATARYFFRLCFDTDSASLYYRGLAASRLGENLVPLVGETSSSAGGNAGGNAGENASENVRENVRENAGETSVVSLSPARDFITGFFEYGLGDLAYAYAENLAGGLMDNELADLAGDFAAAGRPGESIRLMGLLAQRANYRPTRRNLELLYPRAFQEELSGAAGRWSLPEPMFFGLARTESVFIPNIVSSAGAVGLTQLLVTTADDVAKRLPKGVELKYRDGNADLLDPATNAQLGAWYLADVSARSGSRLLGLLAYNGGLSRVRLWRAAEPGLPEDLFLETVPIAESREYVKKVLSAAAAYAYLYYGESPEITIASSVGLRPF